MAPAQLSVSLGDDSLGGDEPSAPGMAAAVAALSKKIAENQETLQECKAAVDTLEKEFAAKDALLKLERERSNELMV